MAGIALLLILIVAIVIIYKIPHESSAPDAKMAAFYNEETVTDPLAGIEYIQCQLTVNPKIPGYQVKLYPYISVTVLDKNTNYIPILNLYTQEQYTADHEGICILKRENITEELLNLLTENIIDTTFEPEIGCFAVIQYVCDNEKLTLAFELRNGQLVSADEKAMEQVIIRVHLPKSK